jgi:uncharacterized coiled-coil protein SlyX
MSSTEKTSPTGSLTRVSTTEASPITGMSMFTDMKFIVHVAVEIVVLGLLLYYFRSSDSELSDKIRVLNDQIDEQQDEIDKLTSTITHLTQTVHGLTGSMSGLVEAMKRRAPTPNTLPPQHVSVLTQVPTPVHASTPVPTSLVPPTPLLPSRTASVVIDQEFKSPGVLIQESTKLPTLDEELESELAGLN